MSSAGIVSTAIRMPRYVEPPDHVHDSQREPYEPLRSSLLDGGDSTGNGRGTGRRQRLVDLGGCLADSVAHAS